MKIYFLGAFSALTLTFSSTTYGSVTDETLWAQSEYRAEQAAKREAARKEAERLRLAEEAKHMHVFDANAVLKLVADDADEIQEVRVIYKSGQTERFLAPVEQFAAAVDAEHCAEGTAQDSKIRSKVESPFYTERGGRRPVW